MADKATATHNRQNASRIRYSFFALPCASTAAIAAAISAGSPM
jgi:hypothetical protein